MMDATDESQAPNARPPLTKVPIAQLSPTLEQAEEKCIRATVTLVWPYSSATKSLALLLAEPDFRLRRSNGQVKVVFHERVAEKVARSLVGIGDNVSLALKGLDFVGNAATTQTPGRSIAWDLHFYNKVSLEVESSKSQSTVIIDEPSFATHDAESQLPSTPRMTSVNPGESSLSNGANAWGSPAFLRSARSSYGEKLDSAYDPFTEEDGSVHGRGRKRPRYSLRREEWRVLDEPESPREREGTVDWDKALDEEMDLDRDSESASVTNDLPTEDPFNSGISMPQKPAADEDPFVESSDVFLKPTLTLSGGLFNKGTLPSNDISIGGLSGNTFPMPTMHLPTDTPQLRPIPSPGLPIPSPIVSSQNNNQGYFSPLHTIPQAEGAQSLSADMTIDTTYQGLSDNLTTPQSEATPVATEGIDADLVEKEPTLSQGEDVTADEATAGLAEKDQSLENIASSSPGPEESLNPASPQMVHIPEEAIPGVHLEQVDYINEADVAENLHDFTVPAYPELEEDVETGPRVDGEDLGLDSENIGTHASASISLMEDETEQQTLQSIDNPDDVARELSAGNSNYFEPEIGSEEEESQIESEAEDEIISEGAEDEESRDAYYDEDDMYSEEEEEEEDVEEEEDAEEEESDAERPPPPKTTHQEVIVLDSDSEDEATSNQPIPPPSHSAGQSNGLNLSSERRRSSSPRIDSNDEDPVENYEISEESESEDDENQNIEQNDRVDTSDLNDESSVDTPVRDHFVAQQSGGEDTDNLQRGYEFRETEEVYEEEIDEDGIDEEGDEEGDEEEGDEEEGDEEAVYEEIDEEQFDEVGDEAEAIEGEFDEEEADKEVYAEEEANNEHEGGFETSERAQSIINLDSDADEIEEAEQLPFDAGALSEHGIHHYAIDGAADQRTPPPSSFFESTNDVSNHKQPQYSEYRPGEFQQGLETEYERDENHEPLSTLSDQLLTPDHTQEAAPLPESTAPQGLINNSPTVAPASPSEIQIPLPSVPESSFQDGQLGEDAEVAPTTDLNVEMDDAEIDRKVAAKVLVTKPQAPDRHASGLRSKLSYFAPLATLIDHYNALVDTISIVHEATPMAKANSGSKDFYITIQLTDPSMAGTSLQAQIFRRRKSVLPSINPGDAILLRDFKVRTYDHSVMLVSVESSSWAVFDGTDSDAQINGPPVEYGVEEIDCASDLRTWYSEVGMHMLADSELQAAIERDSVARELSPDSAIPSEAGSFDSGLHENSPVSSRGLRRSRNSHRRVTIHELRDGTRYTEVGSPSTKESIHELRDGTVYATR